MTTSSRAPLELLLTPGAIPLYVVSLDAMGNLVTTSTRQGGTILSAVEVDVFDAAEVARAVSDAIAADHFRDFRSDEVTR